MVFSLLSGFSRWQQVLQYLNKYSFSIFLSPPPAMNFGLVRNFLAGGEIIQCFTLDEDGDRLMNLVTLGRLSKELDGSTGCLDKKRGFLWISDPDNVCLKSGC